MSNSFVLCSGPLISRVSSLYRLNDTRATGQLLSNQWVESRNRIKESNSRIESRNRINESNPWIESRNRIKESNQWIESRNRINESNQWFESKNRIKESNQWIESRNRIKESNSRIESMNRINEWKQWIESMNRIDESNQWIESLSRETRQEAVTIHIRWLSKPVLESHHIDLLLWTLNTYTVHYTLTQETLKEAEISFKRSYKLSFNLDTYIIHYASGDFLNWF